MFDTGRFTTQNPAGDAAFSRAEKGDIAFNMIRSKYRNEPALNEIFATITTAIGDGSISNTAQLKARSIALIEEKCLSQEDAAKLNKVIDDTISDIRTVRDNIRR